MNAHRVSGEGVEPLPVEVLPARLEAGEGFVWLDVPRCDAAATRVLKEVFRFHPLAVQDCLEPGHMPKIHAYSDHIFLMLQVPVPEERGQVHRLELNQFIGRRFLVTVHENDGVAVPSETAQWATRLVLERMRAGRFRPGSPAELSYAIVSSLARRMEAQVARLASRVAALEAVMIGGKVGNPDPFLDELFRLRHELLTVRTVAAQNREMYLRMNSLAPRFVPAEERPYVSDLGHQLERVQSLCDEERDFLEGVLDYYRTRSSTRTQFAMQRVALLSALLLPVTAVASIYGMNVIVNDRTDPAGIVGAFVVMGLLVAAMLWWSRRQGWW